jgi:hypothetical protein
VSPEIRARARRRHLERNWRYYVVYPIAGALGSIAFPFRHPILWIWLRRMDLHRFMGFELPPPPRCATRYRRWV